MQKAKVLCLILALVLSSVGTVMVAQNLNGETPSVVLPTDAVNTYLDKPTEGDPSTNDAITNLYIAAGELKRSGGFVGTTYGQTVSVGLAQEVSNKRTVVNGNVFKEMATVGVVKNAYQLYLYGDNYLYRKPDKINNADDIKWSSSAQKFTKDDFLGKFGHCSNELTGYILNQETVLEGTLENQENGLFTYRYVLDKVKAPAYMLYEMRANSNMKGFSTFNKAEIVVTMDANWQVKTLRTDCEYNVPMFGGVKCTEDITETFTEIGYQGDLPEKDFFEQFFDAQAVTPVEPTDDALTVLMDIFDPYITGGKLNVSLNAKFNDKTILSGLVSAKIDIEHLENIAVDVKLGEDLYVSYDRSKLFVTYQDFKGSTTVDGIMGLVQTLMPNGSDNGGDLSDDDILANANYEIKDGVCKVNLPLALGELVLDVNFYANVNGDKYEFTSAAATLGDITVDIVPVGDISVPERNGEYPEILGLTDLVKNGVISARVNAFGTSADVLFDIASNNLYAKAGDIELTMQQQTLFASMGELKLTLALSDINDLLTLVKTYFKLDGSLPIPDVTVDGVLSALNTISATTSDGGVIFSLELGGVQANVKLVASVNGWSLSEIAVVFGENTVTLCPNDDVNLQIPTVNADEYVDVTDVAETFLTPIVNLIKAESYGAEFNANVAVDGKTYNLNGDFVYDRLGNISVNALLSNADKTLLNANVAVADGAVYIDVNGVKTAFKLAEISDGASAVDISRLVGSIKGANGAIDKLLESVLSVVDKIKNADLSALDWKETVKSFTFENKTINITVNAQAFGLGEFEVALGANRGNLIATVVGLTLSDIVIDADVAVKTNVKDVAVTNTEDYVTELKLDVMGLPVNVRLDLYNMTATAYTTLLNTELAILYRDGTAYVNYGALKAKLNIADIDRLFDVIKQFIPNASDRAIQDILGNINVSDVIGGLGFVSDSDGYALTLAFGGINAEVRFITNGSSVTLDNVNLSIGDVRLTATLTSGNEYPQVITDDCVDLVAIAEAFAPAIKNLLSAQGYGVNVKGTVAFGGHAYCINAEIVYSGGLYVNAGVSYNGTKMIDAEIWFVDNVMYLKSDKLTLAVSVGGSGGNSDKQSVTDTLNSFKGYNEYLDVLIDFVNGAVAKLANGGIEYVQLVNSLAFDGSKLTIGVDGSQLDASVFTVTLNATDGLGVSVEGLAFANVAVDIESACVKAASKTVARPDGDFTTNLTIKIDDSNTVNANIDLLNGVYRFKLKNLNVCYSNGKIRINYDDQILVQGDVDRISELVKRIDDLVHEFSGATDAGVGLDIIAVFGDINVKEIINSLTVANTDGGVRLGLTLASFNVSAIFTDGKLDKMVLPIAQINKTLEIRASDKAAYYEFSDTDDYVAIEQVLDDYMPAIEQLVATNCWKFTFTQDSFVTVDKTVYTLNAGSYFEFYYNETDKGNTQLRAKLTLSTSLGNGANKTYSIDVALKKDENGANRIYVTYNNKLRASVSLEAVMGCKDEFTKLQSAIPQIGDLIGKIFAAKDEVEGKEIDYSTIIKELSYRDQVFNISLNGNVLLAALGDVTLNAGLYGNGFILNNLELKYDTIQVKLQGMTVEASATVGDMPYQEVDKAEDYTAVQDILAYDSATYHINFDSIKQLLSAVNVTATDGVKDETTGNMLRSFNIEGSMHLGIPIAKDVDIKLFAKVDINEHEKTFFTVKIVRGNGRASKSSGLAESIAFYDNGGESYLYFDGERERISVVRNCWTDKEYYRADEEYKYCSKCGSEPGPLGNCNTWEGWERHGKKYIVTGTRRVRVETKIADGYHEKNFAALDLTLEQFTSNIMDYILEMVNFSNLIEKEITKPQGSDKEILIENVIKDYRYSEIDETMTLNDNSQVHLSGKFTLDLALSQISSALGDITLDVKHEDDCRLRNVSGTLKLASIITASLDLNLTTPNYGDATAIVKNAANSEIAYW